MMIRRELGHILAFEPDGDDHVRVLFIDGSHAVGIGRWVSDGASGHLVLTHLGDLLFSLLGLAESQQIQTRIAECAERQESLALTVRFGDVPKMFDAARRERERLRGWLRHISENEGFEDDLRALAQQALDGDPVP